MSNVTNGSSHRMGACRALRRSECERLMAARTCRHAASDGCACRKPKPGLLAMEAAIEPVLFEGSWMVGDRDSDVAAGLAVGCHTVFIDRGWAAETGRGAGAVAWTLAEAVDTILGA